MQLINISLVLALAAFPAVFAIPADQKQHSKPITMSESSICTVLYTAEITKAYMIYDQCKLRLQGDKCVENRYKACKLAKDTKASCLENAPAVTCEYQLRELELQYSSVSSSCKESYSEDSKACLLEADVPTWEENAAKIIGKCVLKDPGCSFYSILQLNGHIKSCKDSGDEACAQKMTSIHKDRWAYFTNYCRVDGFIEYMKSKATSSG